MKKFNIYLGINFAIISEIKLHSIIKFSIIIII